MREQRSQYEDGQGQDLHSLTGERAKALLECRARCTSARFWIQSELLDLRVGCSSPSRQSSSSEHHVLPSATAPASAGDNDSSDPGIVGDLPSLMKRYLTCPLLSKLLQQDPVLSGKLATLDHVLWHRRSKHEPQTSGWMSHDPSCPEGCSFGAPCTRQAGSEAGRTAVTGGMCGSTNGSSRTSTMDSMAGGETLPGAASTVGAPSGSPHAAETPEDDSRPVTAWVSCDQCMEHFAYIAASLLVFLKPSELRDLALERQQSQCCGFVFCGRRNVATPEKRRAALWRWTLDFGGSKTLSEDELVQFCCSRCCNRQQQLLRLLDEEPMYSRPGIKEWIGDALQRKAAYRPHPHKSTEGETPPTQPSPRIQQEEQQDPRASSAAPEMDLTDKRSDGGGKAAPVELDVLLSEGPESLEAHRLVGHLVEKRASCMSFSTESSIIEITKLGSVLRADGFSVPLTVEDDDQSSEEDEAAAGEIKKLDSSGILTAEGTVVFGTRALPMGQQEEDVCNNFLKLNYSSSEGASGAQGVASSASDIIACGTFLPGAVNGAVETAKAGVSSPPDKL